MDSKFKKEDIEALGFIYFKHMNGYHAYSKLSDKVKHIDSDTPAKIMLMTDVESKRITYSLNRNVKILISKNSKDSIENMESIDTLFIGTLNSIEELKTILNQLGV